MLAVNSSDASRPFANDRKGGGGSWPGFVHKLMIIPARGVSWGYFNTAVWDKRNLNYLSLWFYQVEVSIAFYLSFANFLYDYNKNVI